MLHLPDVLRLLGNRVVLPGKPQRLLETLVFLLRHQETQTQIGQPDGESFPHGLDALRHGRGDILDTIGLIVGLGGEDQFFATQIFVPTSGDVRLDGLATLWRVDAAKCVSLRNFIKTGI